MNSTGILIALQSFLENFWMMVSFVGILFFMFMQKARAVAFAKVSKDPGI